MSDIYRKQIFLYIINIRVYIKYNLWLKSQSCKIKTCYSICIYCITAQGHLLMNIFPQTISPGHLSKNIPPPSQSDIFSLSCCHHHLVRSSHCFMNKMYLYTKPRHNVERKPVSNEIRLYTIS